MSLTLEDFQKLPKFRPSATKIIPLIPEWAQAYDVPVLAIEKQLAWAHGWILSNPKKAPKKDFVRFLFNWMRKAKEFGNLVVNDPRDTTPRAPDPEPDMSIEEMIAIRKQNMGGR